MSEKALKNQLSLKELELNSVLEITQAINNNLPEDSLFKIYDFTIRANLNISRLALYVLESKWVCKVNFGTENNFKPIHELPDEYSNITDIEPIDYGVEKSLFGEFDFVIPVLHKTEVLAYVFAGIDENQSETLNTTFLQAISNLLIVAIENKRLARRELNEQAFQKELEIAKDVQKYLFPDSLPNGIRLKMEASYLPHHTVGGDYYDYIPINKNQFLICIADVSGKGIPAAIMMSNFQASLRTLTRQTPNLSEIVAELNYQILDNAKGESFITFFVAIYDHSVNSMVYVNSGHNPPILVDQNKEMRLLTEGSTILGIFHPLPFINEGFISDLENFMFFSYTDGLTETSNITGEEYGSDRLEEYIRQNHHKKLSVIHEEILAEIDLFRGNEQLRDDITMLSCRVKAQG